MARNLQKKKKKNRAKVKRRDFKYLAVTEQFEGAGGNPATGPLAVHLYVLSR